MDNTQKKQNMSSAERKRKERQRKLAAMTDEEERIQIERNKRRSELRRKQLNSISKADLDA